MLNLYVIGGNAINGFSIEITNNVVLHFLGIPIIVTCSIEPTDINLSLIPSTVSCAIPSIDINLSLNSIIILAEEIPKIILTL